MIRRLLATLEVRIGLVGAAGVAVTILGVLVDQWRLAALGFGLTALTLVVLSLLVLRGLRRAQRAVGNVASFAGGSRSDGGALGDELSLMQAVDRVLERRDLVASVSTVLRDHAVAERAELAALIRLVATHDTEPAVPLATELPASQTFAVLGVLQHHRPRRVLAVGTGVATLWAARTLRDLGATLDVVCDEASSAHLDALISARDVGGTVRVVPVARAVPDAAYAVRPWFVLPDDRYDMVVVAAATAVEARAALPALPLLLQRLTGDGRLVIVEDQARPILAPAWSAAPTTLPDVHGDGGPTAGIAVVLRAAPDAEPVKDVPEPVTGTPEDVPR